MKNRFSSKNFVAKLAFLAAVGGTSLSEGAAPPPSYGRDKESPVTTEQNVGGTNKQNNRNDNSQRILRGFAKIVEKREREQNRLKGLVKKSSNENSIRKSARNNDLGSVFPKIRKT